MVHVFFYLATMGLLILIWGVTGAGFFWPFFAIFGWGFAVGFHVITYLMYNDKIEYLSKVKEKSAFAVLFIFHAWFYISVNVFLIIINLVLVRTVIFFIYPLFFWGIAFLFHALGFFLWEKSIKREMINFKERLPSYEEKRLKMMATSKITNFWLVIIHIAYYVTVNIWLYTINQSIILELEQSMEMSLIQWGSFLLVHVFSYALYYHVRTITGVIKGLIIHLAFYGVVNTWQVRDYYKNPTELYWPLFPLILWGVLIAYHVYIAFNWNSVIESAVHNVKEQFRDRNDLELRSKARWFVFWKWSFIAHATMWGVGIVLIGISLALLTIQIGLLIHPAMGWLIAVCIHGSLFYIVLNNIEGFWKRTALIHLATYISTGVYLIILNILTSIFPWSAIALAGWGIGLGFHILLAYLINK